MTKLKKKEFMGGIYSFRGKSMTIMTGSMAADRHGTGAGTENLGYKLKEWCGLLRPQSLSPVAQLFQAFPKTQIYEPIGGHSHSNHHSFFKVK